MSRRRGRKRQQAPEQLIKPRAQQLFNPYQPVEALDAGRERLTALQDHIEAAQASALGRNSYVLSVVAAIFLPLGFLTGLFGINVGGMPLVENPWGFWSVSLASALIGVGLFVLFRRMKWL